MSQRWHSLAHPPPLPSTRLALLNLPQHHRVHHAINSPYLDKNYGATSIVWDRLFGSNADEQEEPVYGITKPLASFNPLWAQVHYGVELANLAHPIALRADTERRSNVARCSAILFSAPPTPR